MIFKIKYNNEQFFKKANELCYVYLKINNNKNNLILDKIENDNYFIKSIDDNNEKKSCLF